MDRFQNNSVQIVDIASGEWSEHPRFKEISMKPLLSSSDNPNASVNVVRVPPGKIISSHTHTTQIETVFVIQGKTRLRISGQEFPFEKGNIVALPAGVAHELENVGQEMVELLTIFTPPLS